MAKIAAAAAAPMAMAMEAAATTKSLEGVTLWLCLMHNEGEASHKSNALNRYSACTMRQITATMFCVRAHPEWKGITKWYRDTCQQCGIQENRHSADCVKHILNGWTSDESGHTNQIMCFYFICSATMMVTATTTISLRHIVSDSLTRCVPFAFDAWCVRGHLAHPNKHMLRCVCMAHMKRMKCIFLQPFVRSHCLIISVFLFIFLFSLCMLRSIGVDDKRNCFVRNTQLHFVRSHMVRHTDRFRAFDRIRFECRESDTKVYVLIWCEAICFDLLLVDEVSCVRVMACARNFRTNSIRNN